LMLRAPPGEGESLERMVVRTPVVGGVGAITARHVAPPKASQLLAELHGMFDADGLDGAAAGYVLASRESAGIDDGAQKTQAGDQGLWYQPAAQVVVGWLPDPHARGVALTGRLPGDPVTGTTRRLPFDGALPDLQPFRIDLAAVAGAPAAPAWNAVERILTVELAPAQRATVRINCALDPADLDSRGVWSWTVEQAPPNLAAVRAALLDGRHWAHLPWRDITLLHAVQMPLEAPAITAVTPTKVAGATAAELKNGTVTVDGASTGRVQI
jgi:hypothetical protein